MWWFNRREEKLNSDEFETLSKKISQLSTQLDVFEMSLRSLAGQMKKRMPKLPQEEEKSKTENDIKPSIFLSPMGEPLKDNGIFQ
jgi:hypothetical protein